MQAFYQWSEANLGQWHYVLGYLLVLGSHNWSMFLATVVCAWFSYRAYRYPSRLNTSWLLTALFFGLAYQYEKHLAVKLHQAIDFLFGLEIAALNRPLHILVGTVANTILFLIFFIMLTQSIYLSLRAWRPAPPASRPAPE